MYFQNFARVLSLKRVIMKSTHEKGEILIHQMILVTLENRKWISAIIDDTEAFFLLCFQYLAHRLSIVVVKSSLVKERSVIDIEKQ